jgi:2,3-bisphosphoglycerate-independent phosphoglycerate mutase
MKTLQLYYTTMTQYDQSYKGVNVMFENDDLKNTLGEILEQNNRTQIRIAETEKYPHVSFFFSGGVKFHLKVKEGS